MRKLARSISEIARLVLAHRPMTPQVTACFYALTYLGKNGLTMRSPKKGFYGVFPIENPQNIPPGLLQDLYFDNAEKAIVPQIEEEALEIEFVFGYGTEPQTALAPLKPEAKGDALEKAEDGAGPDLSRLAEEAQIRQEIDKGE